MAHEFVVEAQTFRIEQARAVGGDHDRVVERTAARQARGAQRRDFLLETEGARARDFLAERFGRQIEGQALPADRLGGEIDVEIGREPGAGQQFEQRVVGRVGDAYGLHDFDRAAGGGLFDGPGAIDQEQERGGRTVHHRDFVAVEFDDRVVDPRAVESGHQVLDRAKARTRCRPQQRAQARVGHVAEIGLDRRGVAAPAEGDALVGSRRKQCHRDLATRMQPGPRAGDRAFQGALRQRARLDGTRNEHFPKDSERVGHIPLTREGRLCSPKRREAPTDGVPHCKSEPQVTFYCRLLQACITLPISWLGDAGRPGSPADRLRPSAQDDRTDPARPDAAGRPAGPGPAWRAAAGRRPGRAPVRRRPA